MNAHDDGSAMRDLSTSECWSRLRSSAVGRLAVRTLDDDVDIFPVNHVVDGGTIVFRSSLGTKLTALADGPRVAFEVDGVDADRHAWSVVVKGSAEVIDRRDEIIAIFDLDVDPWHVGDKPIFVRLTPTSVTGRDFEVAPDPANPP